MSLGAPLKRNFCQLCPCRKKNWAASWICVQAQLILALFEKELLKTCWLQQDYRGGGCRKHWRQRDLKRYGRHKAQTEDAARNHDSHTCRQQHGL